MNLKLLLFMAATPVLVGRGTGPISASLVLTGVTLIDGSGAPPRPSMTIVIGDGKITAVYADGAEPVPSGSEVRDLRGHWVLPGLIDAHVHVATNPSDSDRRDRVVKRLENAILGGVVAVRDMGGDGRALAELARAAAVGDITAPLIRYSAIMAGPDFFGDPRVRASSGGIEVGTGPWARAIRPGTDVRQIVAEAKGAGVTGVKFYAALDSATLAPVVAEAKRQGLKVWAHAALFPARPGEVVDGGVEVVSHAPLLAWAAAATMPAYTSRAQAPAVGPNDPAVRALLGRMKARSVILEPTLYVYQTAPGVPDTSAPKRRERLATQMTAEAFQAGIRIAAGTDGIGDDSAGSVPNLHEELRLLVQAGLRPMDALVAATRTNAEVLGISVTHGTVEVGKVADLLILRADPLADIRNTRAIAFVLQRGKVLKRS